MTRIIVVAIIAMTTTPRITNSVRLELPWLPLFTTLLFGTVGAAVGAGVGVVGAAVGGSVVGGSVTMGGSVGTGRVVGGGVGLVVGLGFTVVGFAVVGLAVVGFAVVGAAVVGLVVVGLVMEEEVTGVAVSSST